MTYLDENNLLFEHQFGFRPKRSTELAAILFIDQVRKEVDNGNIMGAIFIDFSKAFDTISHAKLLIKLSAYGIKGIELSWFTDYLFNRTQIVNYYNTSSKMHSVTCGVPQGSILGLLLFILYL